jgi:hypothetical protein
MPDSNKNSDSSRAENEPSMLDELTHAELSLLYKESTDTVRFAKNLQWWTVGSTLITFLALIGIARMVSADRVFTSQITGVVILLTMAVIFTLVVYQFWQHTELAKIEVISRNFSSMFTDIRRMKSRREANVHRYLLLGFMIAVVLMGAVVTYLGLLQLVLHRFQ